MNPTLRPRGHRRTYFSSLLILSFALAIGYSFAPASIAPYSAQAQEAVTVINAASFASDKILSPGAIAAAFGNFKTLNNGIYRAVTVPLPTSLGGMSVSINGVAAGLTYAQSQIPNQQFGQINLVIPEELADGTATIVVTNSDATTLSGTFTVVRSRPGIFTSNSSGNGAPAAQTTNDGVNYVQVGNNDGTPREISAGTKVLPNFLVLYLTAVHRAPAQNPGDGNGVAEAIKVTFNGVEVIPDFAGPVTGYVGLDQINVKIPWALAGLGYISVKVFASNGQGGFQESNQVTVLIGGTVPDIVASPITDGQTINGELTNQDFIQQDDNDNLFFFDAYQFQTNVANATVAIDLRSNTFDAAVLLYRLDGSTLVPVASDDVTGTFGGETTPNNALLLTVLPQPAQYVILATTAAENPLGTGPYQLTLKGGVVTPISYGTNLPTASIDANDIKNAANTFIDAYWFSGSQGDHVITQMTSTGATKFAPLVVLQRSNGSIIAFDENQALTPTARVDFVLPQTGNYVILGTPFEPNVTGPYSFSLQRVASASASAADQDLSVTPENVREFQRLRIKQSAREIASPLTRETRFDAMTRRRFRNIK